MRPNSRFITARQKVQHLEAMIGHVDFDHNDFDMLQDIIDIYKNGNEPFFDKQTLAWLDASVDKYSKET